MLSWYSRLTLLVKCCGKLSRTISVYVDIGILSNCTGGITIHNECYNVFCYADNLIIFSLSVSGLQDMINAAKSYIAEHGLRFNPTKTICKTFGT